jgi:titin
LGNGGVGISLYGGAETNSIGGTAPGAGNLISANGNDGIQISGLGTSYNLVQGNLVGTTRTGSNALGNAFSAVSMFGGPSFNTIGGTTAAARNILSAGTNGAGVYLSDPGTSNNVIQGNHIGTDISGTAPMGNNGVGVVVGSGAASNLIGGTVAGAGNVISANYYDGLQLYGPGTSYNLVQGNFIGTDKTGSRPLGNGFSALSVFAGALLNTVGGTTAAARNLLSASTNYDGVFLSAATNNTIQGNYIGTDITGLLPFANGTEGLTLFGASQNNLIGGSAPGAGNVIAASKDRGIFVADPGTSGNLIQGNNIGVGANGTTPLGNALQGIIIDNGAQGNVIGLSVSGSGAGNLIADNVFEGIILYDAATVGNTIRGNSLFNNGSLGFNLVGGIEDGFGVTANHPGGPVPGPNNLQNYPGIAAFSYPGANLITGTLNSAPGHSYLIDLYWNAAADPSGHGEGQLYLGHANMNTDASGNGTFTFLTTSNLTGGKFSATATDAVTGDTSEFSADVVPTSGPPEFVGGLTKGSSGFSFSLLLQTNVGYHIQATTNLGAHPIIWSNLTSFVAGVSPFQFTDHAATNIPVRFYRAVSP